MEKEQIENAIEEAKILIAESDEKRLNDGAYIAKATEDYKNAVNKVYDKTTSDAINLMNGVIAEQNRDLERVMNDAINMLTLIPHDYAKIINIILNTKYKNEDFQAVVEKHVAAAREDVRKYIEETRQEKRKLSKAEEMRKELNEAKAAFEKLKQPKEEKMTVWQRIKVFFGFKKDDIIFCHNRGLCPNK